MKFSKGLVILTCYIENINHIIKILFIKFLVQLYFDLICFIYVFNNKKIFFWL